MPARFCNICPITEGSWQSATPCRNPYSSSGPRNDTNVPVLSISVSYAEWGWWRRNKRDNIPPRLLNSFPSVCLKISRCIEFLYWMCSQSKRHFQWLTAHFKLPQSPLGFSHTLKRWKWQQLDVIDRITDPKEERINKAKVERGKSKRETEAKQKEIQITGHEYILF